MNTRLFVKTNAMTYEAFTAYPLEIKGITAESDEHIVAISDYVLEKLEYTGDAIDLDGLLPYFVYFHFVEDLLTDVSVRTGETSIIREESNFSTFKMCKMWNEGVTKLLALLAIETTETANLEYQSKREQI